MNLFGISSVFIFFSSIGFGLFVYSSNRQSAVVKRWLALSVSIAFWGLGLYGVTSFSTYTHAIWAQYLLDISAIFIPVTVFDFMQALAEVRYRKITFISYIFAIIFVCFSISPLFKAGLITQYGFYWINPGPLYVLFPIYFTIYVLISLGVLYRGYKRTTSHIKKLQIRNTLIAGVVGFSGGITNFFPQLFGIYPFGNYFVILYVFFMSYGVLRFKLLNTKIIATQLFVGALGLIMLFNLVQSGSIADWIIKFISFIVFAGFGYQLVLSVYREVEQRELLAKANEDQTNLIYFITHQVKGFFTKSRGIFAALVDQDFGETPEYIKPLVQEGLESGTKGVTMVQEVLDASNIRKGTIEYNMQDFDLAQLVKETYAELKSNAESKGLNMSLVVPQGEISIHGDDLQLKQVVKNLIDNAIRYTLKGEVNVSLAKQDNKIVFSVKDSGVGITDEDKKRLFTAGGRGKESRKVNVDSTGFGLYIVRKIVEAHGGKISATSTGPNQGSAFTAEFPVGGDK